MTKEKLRSQQEKIVKAFFHAHGCQLISPYVNSKTPMDYICQCGNPDTKDWDHFKRGQRCDSCAKEKMANAKRLDPEAVRQYYEEQGCILLDDFVEATIRMKYICSCGELDYKSFRHFKRGQRCVQCANQKNRKKRGLNPNSVSLYFELEGCEILEPYESYHKPMEYRCVCGRQDTISLANFRAGKRCRQCGTKKLADLFRTDPKFLADFFSQYRCKLFTPYVKSRGELWFICSCGNVSDTTWRVFQDSNCCKKCSWEKTAEKCRHNFEYVKTFFEEQGCKLLSTEYTNAFSHLDYVCECGNSGSTFSNFYKGKRCGCKVRTGEDHPHWTGLTPVKSYLRTKIDIWKQESRELCHYRCVITGDARHEVHHLYPFSKIVVEVIAKLKFPFARFHWRILN